MKKKLALLVLVTLIALVTATPALASRGNGEGGKPSSFTLCGYITAIGSDTITVQALNDRFAGQELTVQVTSSTSFLMWTADGRVPVTFGDVEVGDSTNIKGTIVGDVFVASQVTVDVPLNCVQ
jgi:hypothetical protein